MLVNVQHIYPLKASFLWHAAFFKVCKNIPSPTHFSPCVWCLCMCESHAPFFVAPFFIWPPHHSQVNLFIVCLPPFRLSSSTTGTRRPTPRWTTRPRRGPSTCTWPGPKTSSSLSETATASATPTWPCATSSTWSRKCTCSGSRPRLVTEQRGVWRESLWWCGFMFMASSLHAGGASGCLIACAAGPLVLIRWEETCCVSACVYTFKCFSCSAWPGHVHTYTLTSSFCVPKLFHFFFFQVQFFHCWIKVSCKLKLLQTMYKCLTQKLKFIQLV